MAPLRRRLRKPDGVAVHLSWARQPSRHVLVSLSRARTDGVGSNSPRRSVRRQAMTALAPTLQAFFTDRLMSQRGASPHTIAAYRDTFRLLFRYTDERTHKQPCDLDVADLDAPLVGAFLDHLERDRHNSVRTRNNRLAAIHSLFHYAAYAEFGISRVMPSRKLCRVESPPGQAVYLNRVLRTIATRHNSS